MAQLALYRKYRSQTFGDLMGQEHVVRTLQNAFSSGKVAQSFLFTGPRGTGKTSTARLVAKALSCTNLNGTEPCNECEQCLSITDGSSMDVLEFDAASEAGVDEVREKIVGAVEYMPVSAPYRVFIIDEVHDLSPKAFDALLKTIEEPPAHIVFILATTEFHKVPATIRSRCQKFEFHRASVNNLVDRIKFVAEAEGYQVEPAAVQTIARMADGGYRDALTLLEQLLLTCEGTLTQAHVVAQLGLIQTESVDKILLGMASGDAELVLRGMDETYQLGRDPRSILEACLMRVSDLTRGLYNIESSSGSDATADAAARELAVKMSPEGLARVREAIGQAHKNVKDVTLPKIWLESWLVAAAQPAPQVVATKPTAPQAKPVVDAPVPTKAVTPEPAATAQHPWKQVVADLSEKSPLARMHLEKSAIATESDKEVVIMFERAMDLDWVEEKPKVKAAIMAGWATADGKGRKLVLKAGTAVASAPVPSDSAVELPAEGEKLHELTKETFEGM
ncbi:MAG: DNA polymerase III subunit gamma/tau [Chthonomonas sp.]|nr:DNA polymerase III subunit gamma/tau [Chthonomonas sp.]